MIDALFFISQRPIVIALAMLGAVLVTTGALIAKPSNNRPDQEKPASRSHMRSLARHLTSSGYAITFASIVLFIIAGFVSDLHP